MPNAHNWSLASSEPETSSIPEAVLGLSQKDHGEERAEARFNKVVEKIADYARLEISKDIFYLIRDGVEP